MSWLNPSFEIIIYWSTALALMLNEFTLLIQKKRGINWLSIYRSASSMSVNTGV